MTAKYQLIANSLRDKIRRGVYQPGDKLPTEVHLRQEWGVAVGTVRNALALLQSEGLIKPDSPRGWFVRRIEHLTYRPQSDGRTLESLSEREPWVQQILTEGRSPRQSIEVAIVTPSPVVVERLSLADGERAAVRRRVRFINDEPVNISDSYYPFTIAEGTEILSPDDIPEGVSRVLADHGYIQSAAVDEFEIRTATPEEQTRLSISPGQPVAEHRCTTFTADKTPVRCTINILPGDRHLIVYERSWDVHGVDGQTT